jgi:VanZ family protein
MAGPKVISAMPLLGYSIHKLAQVISWLLVGLITLLSVVPPSLRPVSGAGQSFEHAGVFFLTGLFFAIGHRLTNRTLFLLAILFAGGIEILQIPVPGRHARLADFVVDMGASLIGILLAAAWPAAVRFRDRRFSGTPGKK